MSNSTTIKPPTKTFSSTHEAFQYFIDEIYPSLSPNEIGKVKKSVFYFRNNMPLSNDKIEEILEKYGNVKVSKKYDFPKK